MTTRGMFAQIQNVSTGSIPFVSLEFFKFKFSANTANEQEIGEEGGLACSLATSFSYTRAPL